MHISIKIAVTASLALLTTLTVGGIVAERARAREVQATLDQEGAKQQRFAEDILRREIRSRTEQYDALRPVDFWQLASNQPHNPDRWGECMIAFTAYEFIESEEHHPGTREFTIWGLAGLGPEDEKAKQSPYTIRFFKNRAFKQHRILTSEQNALSSGIIDFLDKKIPSSYRTWREMFTPREAPDSQSVASRFGLWSSFACGFGGDVDYGAESVGRFYFEEDGLRLFLLRNCYAPKIHSAIQGMQVNPAVLAESLTRALSKSLPGAKITVEPSPDSVSISGVPMKFNFPPTATARRAVESLTDFRLALLIAWVAGLLFVGVIVSVIAHTHKVSELRKLFSSAIVHDLRSPLARLEAQAELLAEHCREQSPPVAEESEELCRGIRHFRTLTNNFFFAAKMAHTGTRGLHFTTIPVGELIENIVASIEDSLNARQIDLETVLPDAAAEAFVLASENAMERIFANLSENAIRFTDESENAKVTISAKIAENGKAVHVFFEDNGSGISEETRQHLFSSFAPKGDRLGIGLSLSKDLARAQGGDLILQKTDASGTVFLLTLKRVAPKSKPERF
ncbi:MAG: HAMP domain-containing histidine kinase [Opitutales bacterium]|nr:HAMP domain-containing histidine kinase [Opitutales bacterium]